MIAILVPSWLLGELGLWLLAAVLAAGAVALFPLLVLFFLAQRYITRALPLTGSKG